MPHIRTFFAINIPLQIQEALNEKINELKNYFLPGQIKWRHSPNFHITLQFLGNIQEKDIFLIEKNVKKHLSTIKPFSIEIKDIELFPSKNNPHIITIQISSHKEIAQLSKQIGYGVIDSNYALDKRIFCPHLTLGYIVNPDIKNFPINKIKTSLNLKLEVNEIIFFQSVLNQEGSDYHVLRKMSLLKPYSE